jgi:Uma2 family endonuclease
MDKPLASRADQLFFAVRTPPFVPDVLVSLGVSSPANPFPKENRSSFLWEYGKATDLAVEIVSNVDGDEDTTKLKDYAKIGITYYIVCDPELHLSSTPLRVYRLADGRYANRKRACFSEAKRADEAEKIVQQLKEELRLLRRQ